MNPTAPTHSTPSRWPSSRLWEPRPRRWLPQALTLIVLVGLSLLVLLPLGWMLSTSLKPKAQWFLQEIFWIPKTITLDNYARLLRDPTLPIEQWLLNSTMLGVFATGTIVALDAVAAYAYARMEFPGRRLLFNLLLATLFVPATSLLVPNFLTVARLGLLNTYLGVALPMLAGVFGVFFMRQFFESLPRELEEAAAIDGANIFQTFFHVVLPLSQPALATLSILTFLASWNDFLWPLLIIKERSLLTLPPGLRILQGAYTSEYGQMMAGAVIAAVPVLLLYLFAQRYIMESVALTGIKG